MAAIVRRRRNSDANVASVGVAAPAEVTVDDEDKRASSTAAASATGAAPAAEPFPSLDDFFTALTMLMMVRLVPLVGIPTPSALASRLLPDNLKSYLSEEFLASANRTHRFRFDVVTDCDETFNYWEPTHYMLYGRGLQTWEYAPQYALRSYGYTLLHALLALVSGAAWGAGKVQVFVHARMLLAVACAACESAFSMGVAKRFGRRMGTYTLLGLAASAGMLHAAPAFLPSTFTMYGLMLAWAAWLHGGHVMLAAAAAAAGLALGWPFAALALAPVALHVLLREMRSVPYAAAGAAVATALALALQVFTDRVFYGAWVLAQWNLFRYNVLGQGGEGRGSELYGVEPYYFFAQNLAINFNVLALLAAASPLALAALVAWRSEKVESPRSDQVAQPRRLAVDDEEEAEEDDVAAGGAPLSYAVAALAQLWLWFGVMSARPHKEERFMFPVFPLIPLAAAFSLVAIETFAIVPLLEALAAYSRGGGRAGRRKTASIFSASNGRWAFAGLVFLAAGLISLSRVSALVYGFRAPFHVWEVLGMAVQAHKPDVENRDKLDAPPAMLVAYPQAWLGLTGGSNYTPSVPYGAEALPAFSKPGVLVCVGKEWYRFPSHFFLPESTRAKAALYPHPDRRHREGGPAELGFLRSNFTGQLPVAYLKRAGGSAEVREDEFNDANREGPRKNYRFVDHCDFIVDLQLPKGRTTQPQYESHMSALPPIAAGSNYSTVEELCRPAKNGEERTSPPCTCEPGAKSSLRWESVYCEPFMDRESSPVFARSFWIPGYSDAKASFGAYHILQKVDCCHKGGND